MELLVEECLQSHLLDPFQVAGPRPEGDPVQKVKRPALLGHGLTPLFLIVECGQTASRLRLAGAGERLNDY